MPSSPLFNPAVSVAGRTYATLTPDLADIGSRVPALEASTDSLDSSVADLEESTDAMADYIHLGQISSKASDAAVARVPAPRAGTVLKIKTVLNGALATGNATFQGKIGSTNITGGLVTATEASSAAGDVDSATCTAANVVAENDLISVTCGGASTATATADVYVLLGY